MPQSKCGGQRSVREGNHLWGKHAALLCLFKSHILLMQHWNFILSEILHYFFSTKEAFAKHCGLFTNRSMIPSAISIRPRCGCKDAGGALAENWFMKCCLFDFYHACSLGVNTLTLHKLITSQADGFLSEGVVFSHSTVMGELENVRPRRAHAHKKITGPCVTLRAPTCTP